MVAVPRGNATSTSPDIGAGRNGTGYGLFAKKNASGGFHPTVVSLMVLVLLEFAAYAALRYTFRSAHGG
jgi:hypothetical protein